MSEHQPGTRFSDEHLHLMDRRITELSTAVFGTEGQGGMYKYVKDIHDMVKIQNGRVRKLESWRWYVLGSATTSVAIIGLFWKWFEFMASQSSQVKEMFR